MTPLIDRKERDMEGTGRRDPDRISRQDNDRCSFLTAFPICYSIQNVEILISWWLAWLNPLSDCEMLRLIFEVLNFGVPSFKLISNCLKERRTNKYPRFSHVALPSQSRCPRLPGHTTSISQLCAFSKIDSNLNETVCKHFPIPQYFEKNTETGSVE